MPWPPAHAHRSHPPPPQPDRSASYPAPAAAPAEPHRRGRARRRDAPDMHFEAFHGRGRETRVIACPVRKTSLWFGLRGRTSDSRSLAPVRRTEILIAPRTRESEIARGLATLQLRDNPPVLNDRLRQSLSWAPFYRDLRNGGRRQSCHPGRCIGAAGNKPDFHPPELGAYIRVAD